MGSFFYGQRLSFRGSRTIVVFLRIKYNFWVFGYLCKQLSQSKQEEFCVSNPSEL